MMVDLRDKLLLHLSIIDLRVIINKYTMVGFLTCYNKDTDQMCSNWTGDQSLFFTSQTVQSLFLLDPKFRVSSLIL